MTPVMASLAELIRRTEKYKDNYEWFVELAKNFHWIQSQMVESVDKVKLNYRRAVQELASYWSNHAGRVLIGSITG